jgi:hypothetical protein
MVSARKRSIGAADHLFIRISRNTKNGVETHRDHAAALCGARSTAAPFVELQLWSALRSSPVCIWICRGLLASRIGT